MATFLLSPLVELSSHQPYIEYTFVDDLELYLKDNHLCGFTIDAITFILMLFADDMVIFGNTVADLENSLNLLYEYCLKWGLEVNTTKTKIIVFRKRGNIKEGEKWVYKNNELEVVNDFNDLGTVFNCTGSFV